MPLQEEQNSQQSENHGGHVQLRHHALRIKQRRNQQEDRGQKRGRSCSPFTQMNREQEEQQQPNAGHAQHGNAGNDDRIAEGTVKENEVSLNSRRMHIGHR